MSRRNILDTGLVENLGEVIRKARLDRSLSQRALAKEVGVSFPHISKIEAGREPPSDDLLRRIAEVVGLDADELLLAADRLPGDVSDAVLAKRDLAPEFLRTWSDGTITDEDVAELLRRARGEE